MDKYIYEPKGVCSKKMIFDIDGDIVKNIEIIGGCPGNTVGVAKLCKDKSIDYIMNELKGIKCGLKDTSCPDQLAEALGQYKKDRNQ